MNREVEMGSVLTGRWWCCVNRKGVLFEQGGGGVNREVELCEQGGGAE